MLAICGCSWASDFNSADYTSTDVTTNSQLWQYNLGYNPTVYAQPGSTNLKIYTQVHHAINNNFDRCLVFLTSPLRINVTWREDSRWSLKNKFDNGDDWGGKTDIVNDHSPKDIREYIAKYYSEDLEILNGFVITEAIYWKLKQTGKPFHIFTNAFTDYIHKDWKIFEQPEFVLDGPIETYKKFSQDHVPNHLSLIGQTQAKNLVLSYINKKG